MNHYFTIHHAPTDFIADWGYSDTGEVTIDGAIIDPQFMRSCPVALLCDSKAQADYVQRLIMNASLETPTFHNIDLDQENQGKP